MEKQGENLSVNDGPADTPEPAAVAFSILVADDNPLMQELVLTILQGAGCETETADNGHAALAKLEKADFDLIIMDNHMPVMTGVEAIKVIRSREDGKRFIPILSLTADVTGGSREICASAGANVYMEKPFKVDSFLAAVTTLARYGRDIRLNGAA
jgi:CheY-like chemotaxis protein